MEMTAFWDVLQRDDTALYPRKLSFENDMAMA
jgi:hypothetical protein